MYIDEFLHFDFQENSFQETLSRERESHLSRETISSKLKIAYETNLKLQRAIICLVIPNFFK